MPEYKLKFVVEAVSKNKGELKEAQENINGLAKGGKAASSELKEMAASWAGNILGAGTFLEAGKKVIELLKQSVQAYSEAELAMAKRDAIFEATNAETRTSITLLDEYTQTLMRQTAVDDDLIVKQEEILLQFRSLSGDLIPKTLRAAIDMAGGFDGDVLGATESLGRSLEMLGQGSDNAAMALNMLRRQGVILDAETRDLIMSLVAAGNAAEAQTVLLEALADIQGGRAAAAADTLAGKQQQLANSSENLKETIGGVLAPEIERQYHWLTLSADGWTNFIGVITRADKAAMEHGDTWWFLNNRMLMAYLTQGRITQATNDEADAHKRNAEAISAEEAATRDLETQKRILAGAISGDLTQALDDYQKTQAEAEQKMEELRTQGLEMLKRGVSTTSEEWRNWQDAVNDTADGFNKQTEAMRRQVAMMLYQNAAMSLNTEGQLKLARQLGLISEADFTVLSAMEELKQQYDINGDGIVDQTEKQDQYIQKLGELQRMIEGLPPETVITVVTNWIENGSPPNIPGNGSGSSTGGGGTGGGSNVHGGNHPMTAEGGVFEGAQWRVIGEAGAEAVVPLVGGAIPVTIQGGGGIGGGVNFAGAVINIQMSQADSIGDFLQALQNAGYGGYA